MIDIIHTDADNIVGCRIDGKINTADIEKVANYIEEKLKTNRKLRIYVEVKRLKGISLEAFFKDFKFGIKHFNDFEKKAVVTDKEWMKKAAVIADKLFPNIEVRCFSYEDKEKALEWAES